MTMKEFFLDSHSPSCDCHQDKKEMDFTFYNCELNPKRFLFFLNNDFHIITYYRCVEYSNIDFKLYILKKVIEDNKVFKWYNIEKSWNFSKELKDFRIRNQPLKKWHTNVNYIYFDNANKKYAIVTTVPFFDALVSQDLLDANYLSAKNTIEQRGYGWLLNELEELYLSNTISGNYEVDHLKTVDHLIQQINKLTK